jgi:hypothetical protein
MTTWLRGRGLCAAILALAVFAGCSSSQPPALSDGDTGTQNPVDGAIEKAGSDTVELDVGDMACLPGGTLFLTGLFHNDEALGPKRSALLVSRDGGVSWQDSGLGYLNRGFSYLCTSGDSNVWMVECWVVESGKPEHLMASHDGGKTWAALPLNLGHGESPGEVISLDFSDAKKGRLVVDYASPGEETWLTADGGRTWRRAPKGKAAPTASADSKPEGVDAICQLWTKVGGKTKAAGHVRVRTENNAKEMPESLVVEKQDDAGSAWQALSRIPVQYKVLAGNRLQPVCPRQD